MSELKIKLSPKSSIGGPVLQDTKTVNITENGQTVVTPDTGFDGIESVTINTNINPDTILQDYMKKSDAFGSGTVNYGQWVRAIKKLPDNIVIDYGTNMQNAFKYFMGEELPIMNTEDVTYMQEMCTECNYLKIVPNYNTSKVTNFKSCFNNCGSLENAPSWDTGRATAVDRMFFNCTSLKNIPVYNFSSVTQYNCSQCFYNCTSLTNESLNNVLESLGTTRNLSGTYKTLKHWGLTQDQATTCTTLSNWQALSSAGWTTGY